MKRISNPLSMDLLRSFGSMGFFAAALGITMVCYAGILNELRHASDLLYLFKYSTDSNGFNMLIVLLFVLPYTTCFCSDWNSGFIRLSIVRTGFNKYGFFKVLACALSSGASVALGLALYILSLEPWIKLVDITASNFEFFSVRTLGGEFLLNGQYLKYFMVYIYLGFLKGAFWSVVGLCASAYLPNRFVALCTPFITYYVLSIATYRFPAWLRLNKIFDGLCIIKNTYITLIYATLLILSLITCVGLLFVRTVKRRLTNG